MCQNSFDTYGPLVLTSSEFHIITRPTIFCGQKGKNMKFTTVSDLLLAYANQHKASDIFVGSPALETKRQHIENVVSLVSRLYETSPMKSLYCYDLLVICAAMHDIGRKKQFELLGKFWDTEVSHNVLGVDHLDSWLAKQMANYKFAMQIRTAEVQAQINILRDVILYHGRQDLCFNVGSKPYVDMVTAADDLENAAACISYLIREVEEDAKGYRKANPDADQKQVSDYVFDHFKKGEKFDKSVYCHTYAEYVLFAATLMTSSCKKHMFASSLLKEPGYGYASILEGYKDVFFKTLTPEMAEKAYDVLREYADMK